MATDTTKPNSASIRTRLLSLVTLGAFVAGVGHVGHLAYQAMTDSFVAPTILSPDSEVVIQSKLKGAELELERAKTASEVDAIDLDLAADAQAIERLQGLRKTVTDGLGWITEMNARVAATGRVDIGALAEQRAVLAKMESQQERVVEDAQQNAKKGLSTKMDAAKEGQYLNQLKVDLLESDRTRLQVRLSLEQATLAQKSLSTPGAPAMPELTMREDQLVRLELELLRVESDQRAKLVEKRLAHDKLLTIEEIQGQLMARPSFRAAEKSLDVAFVPYTQLEGVHEGAHVYDCVWGLFHCKDVGKVAEVVPGEVILPDPWSNQARGQFVVLALDEHESAKSKTLRVRGPRVVAPTAPPSGESIAEK